MVAEDIKPTGIKFGHAEVDHLTVRVFPCSGRQRFSSI